MRGELRRLPLFFSAPERAGLSPTLHPGGRYFRRGQLLRGFTIGDRRCGRRFSTCTWHQSCLTLLGNAVERIGTAAANAHEATRTRIRQAAVAERRQRYGRG